MRSEPAGSRSRSASNPFEQACLVLADGTRIEADAVIAATGYEPRLGPLAGHLGVLGHRGLPYVYGGKAAALGLRYSGCLPRPVQIGHMGLEAQRTAWAIKNEEIPPAARHAVRSTDPLAITHIKLKRALPLRGMVRYKSPVFDSDDAGA